MIIDDFHWIFDKCKRKIEFYMSYYNGTEFYKYFYQSRKILLELTRVDEITSLYWNVVFLTVIVDNIIKEQNNIANKEKENAKNEI